MSVCPHAQGSAADMSTDRCQIGGGRLPAVAGEFKPLGLRLRRKDETQESRKETPALAGRKFMI